MTESEIEQAGDLLEPWALAMHNVLMPDGKYTLGVIWPARGSQRERWEYFGTLAAVRMHMSLCDTRR